MENENLEKGIYNLDNISAQFDFYLEKSKLKQSKKRLTFNINNK